MAPRKLAKDSVLMPFGAVAADLAIQADTLERWVVDSKMKLPSPIVINSRRYFRRDEIVAWQERFFAKARSTKRPAQAWAGIAAE
jgi:hypothetical protein